MTDISPTAVRKAKREARGDVDRDALAKIRDALALHARKKKGNPDARGLALERTYDVLALIDSYCDDRDGYEGIVVAQAYGRTGLSRLTYLVDEERREIIIDVTTIRNASYE